MGSNVTGPTNTQVRKEKIIHINNNIVQFTSTSIFLNKKGKKKYHYIFQWLQKLKTLQENLNNIEKMEKKKQWKDLEENIS